jgi:hypothetical protein
LKTVEDTSTPFSPSEKALNQRFYQEPIQYIN